MKIRYSHVGNSSSSSYYIVPTLNYNRDSRAWDSAVRPVGAQSYYKWHPSRNWNVSAGVSIAMNSANKLIKLQFDAGSLIHCNSTGVARKTVSELSARLSGINPQWIDAGYRGFGRTKVTMNFDKYSSDTWAGGGPTGNENGWSFNGNNQQLVKTAEDLGTSSWVATPIYHQDTGVNKPGYRLRIAYTPTPTTENANAGVLDIRAQVVTRGGYTGSSGAFVQVNEFVQENPGQSV